MALSPNQIIAAVCPELSGSPSLPVFLEMAAEVTDKGFFGEKMFPYAVAYRACHLFSVTDGGAGGGGNPALGLGQIASMSEGGLSISYATGGAAPDSGGLDSTKFGKLLLGLIKSRPAMGVNTAGLR